MDPGRPLEGPWMQGLGDSASLPQAGHSARQWPSDRGISPSGLSSNLRHPFLVEVSLDPRPTPFIDVSSGDVDKTTFGIFMALLPIDPHRRKLNSVLPPVSAAFFAGRTSGPEAARPGRHLSDTVEMQAASQQVRLRGSSDGDANPSSTASARMGLSHAPRSARTRQRGVAPRSS